MKAFFRIVSFSVLVTLLGACQQSEKPNGIRVSLDPVESSIELSSIVSIDSVIEISRGDYLDFGVVKRSFLLEDKILLQTSAPATLTSVDFDGRVINQFKPDFRLNDITSVSIVGDIIHILDRSSMQVHLLDMNLSYQGLVEIPFYAQSFAMLPDQKISLYVGNEVSTNEGKLITYDLQEREIIRDELEISTNQRHYFNFLTTYHYFDNNQGLFFWESASNNIYKIEPDSEAEIVYTLYYGAKGVEEGFYDKAKYDSPYEFVSDMRAKGYHHRHFKILANNSYLFINFDQADQFAGALYNFDTSKSVAFNDIYDDLIANDSMEDIELSFFTSFERANSFIGFIPFEYFEGKNTSEMISDSTKNYLVLGKITY